MNFFEFIKDLLLNPKSINYIIVIQIPIVICLTIQSFQFFKLGYKEFKRISIAWSINVSYLLVNIFLKNAKIDHDYKLVVRSFFDLLTMMFFFFAVVDSFEQGMYNKLKKIPKLYFYGLFVFVYICKITPGSLHIIPYIHIRFIPAATVDFFVIYLLALYFKKTEIYINQKKALVYITTIYAFIQFLSVLQIDEHEKNLNIYIDNIGFCLGLFLKTTILILLSILSIDVIKKSAKDEKDKLLHKLNFATTILNISNHLTSTKNIVEQENNILKSVLEECLNLLNEKLGFYASYDVKSRKLSILYASDNYANQIGFDFSVEKGISGKAVRLEKTVVMNNPADSPEYFTFDTVSEKKYKTSIDKGVKSAVAIPVILNDVVLGVYAIESKIENCFTETDVSILYALISQALIAIKNIHLVQEIEISKTLFDSLKEIDKNLVNPSLELENMLGIILKDSLRLIKGQLGNIALKRSNDELLLVASTDIAHIGRKIDVHDSISGLAFLKEEIIYVNDINNAKEDYKKLFKNYLGDNSCELAIPLVVRNDVIGVLNIESKEANKFSDSDIEKVKGFSGQAAIAIHISQLLKDVQKYRNGLEALAELEQIILNSSLGLLETLDTILKKGLSLINKKHGEILLVHSNENFIIKKSTSISEENKPYPIKSICGLALTEGSVYLPYIDKIEDRSIDLKEKGVYIPNENEKSLYNSPEWGKMKSELVVPLILKDEVIGVLNIESEEYNDFLEDERRLLVNFAHAAAIAIHIAQLFEEINIKNNALENSVDKKNIEMIVNLGNLINHRIGNEIGVIRTTLRDEFLKGDFGTFSDEIEKEFEQMLICAETALDASGQVSETIEELLVSALTPIDFNEIKLHIFKNETNYSKNGIQIEIIGFEHMKPSLGNLNLLIEVFLELIKNSIKSMPGGGKILISGKTQENQNIITIKDNGYGIAKENFEKIFSKGWSYWKNNNKGGGIGLYDVKLIIMAWGGKIDFKSTLNNGTIFTINFPII